MKKATNIHWHQGQIVKRDYHLRNGHGSLVLWFTGLSGAGKSTLANAVHERLFARGWHTYVLDGDNVRHGLNGDLGFTDDDRRENIRRIGELSKLFVDSGVITLAAFISPFLEDRARVRALLPEEEFVEIYVKCSVDVCEQRDPKGLYKKARAGQISNFTGISSPYEEPVNPELVIDTAIQSIDQSVEQILAYLERQFYLDDVSGMI